MASAAVKMSVETYCASEAHDLERHELVNGELIPREMPTLLHQLLSINLVMRLSAAGLVTVNELHLRLGNKAVRIADVAAYLTFPKDLGWPDEPPYLTVEILSPDDRFAPVLAKCRQYLGWGVEHVWIVDPEEKVFYRYSAEGLLETKTLDLPAQSLRLSIDDLLDGLPTGPAV